MAFNMLLFKLFSFEIKGLWKQGTPGIAEFDMLTVFIILDRQLELQNIATTLGLIKVGKETKLTHWVKINFSSSPKNTGIIKKFDNIQLPNLGVLFWRCCLNSVISSPRFVCSCEVGLNSINGFKKFKKRN